MRVEIVPQSLAEIHGYKTLSANIVVIPCFSSKCLNVGCYPRVIFLFFWIICGRLISALGREIFCCQSNLFVLWRRWASRVNALKVHDGAWRFWYDQDRLRFLLPWPWPCSWRRAAMAHGMCFWAKKVCRRKFDWPFLFIGTVYLVFARKGPYPVASFYKPSILRMLMDDRLGAFCVLSKLKSTRVCRLYCVLDYKCHIGSICLQRTCLRRMQRQLHLPVGICL